MEVRAALTHATSREGVTMSVHAFDQPRVLDLSPGELVRVRSAAEIFSTLDARGALDNMPFMPEMLRYCGQTHSVFKRADKTCDGVGGLRRMENTVHLSKLRCDGSSHGGCQLGCLMYWNEAWLERVAAAVPPRAESSDPPRLAAQEQSFVDERLLPGTVQVQAPDSSEEVLYRCQATEIRRASRTLRWWNLDQYPKDVRNWGPWKLVRAIPWTIFNRLQRLNRRLFPQLLLFRNGETYPFISSRHSGETPPAPLNLQPGEMVRIKTKEEIRKTLTGSTYPPKNRGLSFDPEMVTHCGRLARVGGRASQVIDEQTGKMIFIKSDCVVLDGVVCTADFHRFCTRSDLPFWREAWLERVEPAQRTLGQHSTTCRLYGNVAPGADFGCEPSPQRRA
jgi:hypothetical protein